MKVIFHLHAYFKYEVYNYADYYSFVIGAQPNLSMWNLDLDNNMIVLHFESSSLNPSNNGMPTDCTAVLLSPVFGNISTAMRLSSTTEGFQINDTTATCDLGTEFRSMLSTNPNNTLFLYYETSGAIGGPETNILVDSSNMEYLNEQGTVVTQVIPDHNPPTIASFEFLDLNEGIMVFSFTQPVDVSTFDFADLSFQNSPVNEATSVNVSLTDGSCEGGCEIGRRITFRMAQTDLEQLKLIEGICVSISTCYPHHTDLLVRDFGENFISTYKFGLNYLLKHLILDTTPPILFSCDIDLSLDIIVLFFDEPIDVATFSPLSITLHDFPVETENITLTNVSSVNDPNSFIIVINLGIDADKLKTSTLVASGNDIFISLLPSAFEDIAGNNVQPELTFCNLTNDTHPPSVTSFTLDLNSNLLHVVLSEPILLDSLNISGFKLANSISADVHNTVNLNDSCLVDCDGLPTNDAVRMISIALGSHSLTSIKTDNNIGTTADNTYLFIDDESFIDINGNSFISTGPIASDTVVTDHSPATAVGFSLDMNIGQIVLTFDDVVDVSTWSAYSHEAFIQRAALTYNAKQGLYGITISDNSNVISVNISNLNSLKFQLNYGTATELNTTYLTIQAHAINDIRGVDIIAVTDGYGIIANDYVRDIKPPQLIYFDLDMYYGRLWFYFDEPIAGNRFYPSLFTLQGDSMATNHPSSLSFSFGSGLAYCSYFYYYNIYYYCHYYLPSDVWDVLRINPNIARDANTSNLVIMQGGVNDTSGNQIDMTGPIKVRHYTPGRSELYG